MSDFLKHLPELQVDDYVQELKRELMDRELLRRDEICPVDALTLH